MKLLEIARAKSSRALTALLLVLLASGCTKVYEVGDLPDGADAEDAAADDGQVDTAPEADLGEIDLDPCDPDPCAEWHRGCIDGSCGDCVEGYLEDSGGLCAPEGDPCDPDPCAPENKECVGGFCGACLEGFSEDAAGNCVPPNPCEPNPCKEPYRTLCSVNDAALPFCSCDPGAHENASGTCTFDPCDPSPCTEPFPVCSAVGPTAECGCPAGQIAEGAGCVDDPCDPRPCNDYARTLCVPGTEGAFTCACVQGFELDGEACVESSATNLDSLPAAEGDLRLDDSRQLFADDWLFTTREGFDRRLHPLTREGDDWVVGPSPDDGDIGRANADGSLVFVPEDVREALGDDHPLRDYPWRLYYMGYRQVWVVDDQPAWLCIAAAESPEGPWELPELETGSPAPNCVLRDAGMEQAEVALTDGTWRLSVTRRKFSADTEPGVHVYSSTDGVSWAPLAGVNPVIPLSDQAVSPATYARIGARSRLVWDPYEGRYLGLFALLSAAHGDARGAMLGQSDIAAGWGDAGDPLVSPAILGPTQTEAILGRFSGDMTAWRVGSLWLGWHQKKLTLCNGSSDKSAYAVLVASRDGVHWVQVRDEANALLEAMIPHSETDGAPDRTVGTLTGGPPAEVDGTWSFFVGGISAAPCDDPMAPGGIFRASAPAGRLVGLEQSGAGTATLITRPIRMADGQVASVIEVTAVIAKSLDVFVDSLTPIDTVKATASLTLGPGDYQDHALEGPPLNPLTGDRFRLRFQLSGAGEVFGFRLADPVCTPNPCTDEPERPICDSSTGAAVCRCAPPLHDDGVGGCTDDPCLPDPCTGPNQEGCTVEEGEAVCGCADGFVLLDGLCVSDPCDPSDGGDPCPPPGPDRCHAVNGLAECYCPEGSEPKTTGCTENEARAFVTSLERTGGEIGGIAGADILCTNRAANGGLTGTYGAWLSLGAQDANARFDGGGPWRTWDPEQELWTALVANDYADLVDGSLANPIAWTEFGTAAPDVCAVWTGTTAGGGPPGAGDGLGGDCSTWSSADPESSALAGDCRASDATWTAAAPAACSEPKHLYCLQLP